MLTTAFALALLSTSGFIIVYNKLPRKARRLIEKYSLVTDLATLIAVYALFGGTLTALFAGALVGLFVSALLHIVNNEQDYMFLFDLRDFLKRQLVEAKEMLTAYGKSYNERNQPTVVEAAA